MIILNFSLFHRELLSRNNQNNSTSSSHCSSSSSSSSSIPENMKHSNETINMKGEKQRGKKWIIKSMLHPRNDNPTVGKWKRKRVMDGVCLFVCWLTMFHAWIIAGINEVSVIPTVSVWRINLGFDQVHRRINRCGPELTVCLKVNQVIRFKVGFHSYGLVGLGLRSQRCRTFIYPNTALKFIKVDGFRLN